MKRFLIFIIGIIVTLSSAVAEDITFTASAPSTVEVGDKFRVQFTVNTQDVQNLKAPDFKGFEVVYGPSPSTSSSFQIINGHTSHQSSVTYTFVLLCDNAGTYTIESASIQAEGKTVRSKPLKVRVLPLGQGGTAQQGNSNGSSRGRQTSRPVTSGTDISTKDLFMTATASRTNVFEQEAILLTYKIYTLVNLTQLDGKLPTLDGFQIQEIQLPRNKEFQLETYNGRNYHTVVWSQYVLFPQKSGDLVIPSITYEGVVVQPRRNIDPIDAFFNGVSGMMELKKKITTPSLTIHVSSLPPKPANFSGAVGQFTISSSVNSEEVKTNDALNFKIDINGTGNMKLINTPEVMFPKGFETYDAKVNDNFSLTRNGLSGSKQFEYLAVPRYAGKYTLPEVEFVYFDTASKTYKTLKTEARTINVVKGEGDSKQAVADFTNGQQAVKQLNQDIRYIKLGKVDTRNDLGDLFVSWKYLLCYIVPLLVFAVMMVLGRRQLRENANVAKQRGKKANKVARKRMKQAASFLADKKQNEFYDEVLKALWGYIADKLNIQQECLNKDNISGDLQAKGVDKTLVDEFIKALNDCEFARYAPGDANETMEAVYNDSVSIIGKIENSI
ncbi:MAG: BatD family protein [Bacteroides sp.]|nr:BatD family protein [Roseburia sp.]MCM1346037.1 BatD family protein [Bacteroides sp.]MCM1420198.1 BatD family protein [Bacteroides sp.]